MKEKSAVYINDASAIYYIARDRHILRFKLDRET